MLLVAQRYFRYATITAMLVAVSGFVFFPVATDAAGIPPQTISAHTYSLSTVSQHKAADPAACGALLLQHLNARNTPINETRSRVMNIGNSGF